MKDMKIDFPLYILHALHVLHGKINYTCLNLLRLNVKKGNYEISTCI